MKDDELLAVNEALGRFSQHAPQKAELAKLRYFAGMGLKEAGQVLGISEPTAVRWDVFEGLAVPSHSADQRTSEGLVLFRENPSATLSNMP